MVVTSLSAADHNGVSHADTARSPIMTVQAPHSLAPQPKCGPVMPSCPRRISRSERSGSASTSVATPLRWNRIRGIEDGTLLWFDLDYGLSPNCLTTSAHFTISPRRYLSNSSGVIDIGTAPCSVQSLTISGRLTAPFTAAFSLSITGFGVPAGAINPSQMVASYPGTPASVAVGTFGNTFERILPVVGSARTWVLPILGAIAGTASIIICTCPPMTPLRASPLLR